MTTKTNPEPEAPVVLWDENGVTIAGLNALREPTPAGEIKQRPAPGSSGKMLDYIDARFVMDRLDMMAGPQNWREEQPQQRHGGGVWWGLSIRIAGEWITKWDVGDASTIEPIKGETSDAFKRCAVKWGIARDLYDAREDTPRPVQPRQPAPAAQPAPQQGWAQQAQQASNGGWACPIHNAVKTVPAGTSSRTGNPYPAFKACPVQGCDQKEPRQPRPAAPVAVAAPVAPPISEEPWADEPWPGQDYES